MFDSLCQWPFLSWLAVLGLIMLLASRGRMHDERSDLISKTLPVQVRVNEKRIVQTPSEGGRDYLVECADPQGVTQVVSVSRSFYRQTSIGDTIDVYLRPTTDEYVHESDPFAFAKASTSVMWAVAWILIFVGAVDIVVYAVIDQSPWCLVIQSWGPFLLGSG